MNTAVSVPAPSIGLGLPVFMAVSAILFGAKLLEERLITKVHALDVRQPGRVDPNFYGRAPGIREAASRFTSSAGASRALSWIPSADLGASQPAHLGAFLVQPKVRSMCLP